MSTSEFRPRIKNSGIDKKKKKILSENQQKEIKLGKTSSCAPEEARRRFN